MTQGLNILETTAQIILVPPYFENFGKRLVKAPKVFIADSGLACRFLGIETVNELNKSPFLGSLSEGMVAAEILKSQLNAEERRSLYYFRDEPDLEVDFVVPGKQAALKLIECKATHTVTPAMARPLLRLAEAITERGRGVKAAPLLLYRETRKATVSTQAQIDGGQVTFEEIHSGLLLEGGEEGKNE